VRGEPPLFGRGAELQPEEAAGRVAGDLEVIRVLHLLDEVGVPVEEMGGADERVVVDDRVDTLAERRKRRAHSFYLTPRDGRAVPADARANDLAHWQTTLVSPDAGAVAQGIRGSPCAMLSPSVVSPTDRALGFAKGLLIRDPDGHALAVVQP
jgi:hypothetical protein